MSYHPEKKNQEYRFEGNLAADVFKELEQEYGKGYEKSLQAADDYFKPYVKARKDNVLYVEFDQYQNESDIFRKAKEGLELQKKRYGSIINIPTRPGRRLEENTEELL